MKQLDLLKVAGQLRRQAGSVTPDAKWVAETRSTLLMQVKNSSPRKEQQKTGVQDFFRVLRPVMSMNWMRRPSAIVAAVLLVVFGGSWFSVSAAEQALPGDMLYSVKLASEQARLAMTKGAGEKIKLKTEFTERRVDEMNKVKAANLSDKSARVSQAAEVLKRDLYTIKVQLDEVKQTSSPEEIKDAVKLVDQKTLQVANDLQDSKQDMNAEDQAKITEAQTAASETAVKALEVLVEAHDQDNGVVSKEDVADAVKGHAEQVKAMTEGLTLPITDSTSTSAVVTTTTTKATTTTKIATTTPAINPSKTPTSTPATASEQAMEAQNAATEAGQLVDEEKLGEAVAKMKEATEMAVGAQKTAVDEALANQVTSDELQVTSPTGDATSTDSSATSSQATSTDTDDQTNSTTIPTP